MNRTLLTLVCLGLTLGAVQAGPYAPAAGQPGSTAIHKDDPQFVGWASGWQNYLVGTDCAATWQTPEKALGPAAGTSTDIMCLGRGGEITLTFDTPIMDGPGWDFATFENSFNDTVPEPATAWLLCVATLMLALRRRGRC
ncbi:MAG: PEP-CTERM sorting domain-containing protein [Pirellulales bacterium]|nr:PEP-CTERM sorting domain-containing protein [Pirellulales bacterium]